MNEIKRAKINIAKCIREQRVPGEVLQLILENFIKDIDIGLLNETNRQLEIKIDDLTKQEDQENEKIEGESENDG